MDTYKQIDLIDQCYGSLSGYIENQLGFSKAEQQQLRVKYLTAKSFLSMRSKCLMYTT